MTKRLTKRFQIYVLASVVAGAITFGRAVTAAGAAEQPAQSGVMASDTTEHSTMTGQITDVSAARRRRAARNANASVQPVEQPVYTRAPNQANPYYGTPQNFGYGVGDNSQNVVN